MKYITIKKDRQHRIKNNNEIVKDLLNRPETHRFILNSLLYLDNTNTPIYFAQETLARRSGTVRETAHRILHDLKEAGYITITNRGVKKSCLYEVNKIFKGLTLRRLLRPLLPAFVWLPLSLLSIPTKIDKCDYVTQTKNDYYSFITGVENSYNRLSLEYRDSHERSLNFRKTIQIEKGAKMQAPPTPIPVTRTEVAGLRLTLAGQITLSAFPNIVIDQAERKAKNLRTARNPFGLFLSICKSYCDSPKWGLVSRLREEHGIKINDPEIEGNVKRTVEKVPEPQKREYEDKKSRHRTPYIEPDLPLYYYTDFVKEHGPNKCSKCESGFCITDKIRAFLKRTKRTEYIEQFADRYPWLTKHLSTVYNQRPSDKKEFLVEEVTVFPRVMTNAQIPSLFQEFLLGLGQRAVDNKKEQLAELINDAAPTPTPPPAWEEYEDDECSVEW